MLFLSSKFRNHLKVAVDIRAVFSSVPNPELACRQAGEANYLNDRAVEFSKRLIGEAYRDDRREQ
jgi:hypothetical protein